MARRKQVLYWCVLALLLAGWLYIAWNVPYTHDDWDWGLPEGLERWLSGALNNRYAGTFFVLAMTRSQLVKTAVMGGCMFLISLLLGRLAGRGQPDRAFSVTVVTAALLFTTPMDSWQQSLGWVSAFANFVVAAVFLLLVLLLWQRAFSAPLSRVQGTKLGAALFFLCLAAQLFAEHLTLILLCAAAAVLLLIRLSIGGSGRRLRSPDVGSSMTIGGREVQEDFVGTLATQTGLVAVLADGMGKAYGARIASRTAVETFLDLFRDYNAFDNPQYYFRKSFHAANRAILRELGDEGYGAASVGVAMIRENWLFYAVVGNVKLCVFRNGDLVPVSAGHTLDVLAEQSFRTGRLSREDALVMLENHRLYNYLGQDSFKDIEIFDRPISLQRGDIIVLMSDGLYELIPWKEIEDVLSGGQDCQSMAYALMEKVNQNSAEDRDNASVILLRWDGSTT